MIGCLQISTILNWQSENFAFEVEIHHRRNMSKKTFYEYFKESMDSVLLPAPDSLFNTVVTATATIGGIIAVVEKFGTSVTVSELILTAPTGIFSAAFAGEAILAFGGVTCAF